ncbi:MAG: substrate-binding domain-containing protein [Phycisphaerae bacterium]|nr:substrate-binding domain-containing protein [Phycisphaerae bacterium]
MDAQLEQMADEMPGPHIGWAICLEPSTPLLEQWVQVGRRAVLIEIPNSERPRPVPVAALDQPGAGRLALTHLLELGHRRVALVARLLPADFDQAVAMQSAPPPTNFGGEPFGFVRDWSRQFTTSRSWKAIRDDAQAWLLRWRSASPQDRPTAVVARNQNIASLLLELCSIHGVAVPGELSLIGWGSYGGESFYRPLTLASSGTATYLGATAVELLSTPSPAGPPRCVLLPVELLNPGLTASPLAK